MISFMSKVSAAAEIMVPPDEKLYMSIPDTIPINNDEYTSFVISASTIAINGGNKDQIVLVNSIYLHVLL